MSKRIVPRPIPTEHVEAHTLTVPLAALSIVWGNGDDQQQIAGKDLALLLRHRRPALSTEDFAMDAKPLLALIRAASVGELPELEPPQLYTLAVLLERLVEEHDPGCVEPLAGAMVTVTLPAGPKAARP